MRPDTYIRISGNDRGIPAQFPTQRPRPREVLSDGHKKRGLQFRKWEGNDILYGKQVDQYLVALLGAIPTTIGCFVSMPIMAWITSRYKITSDGIEVDKAATAILGMFFGSLFWIALIAVGCLS